MVKLVNCVIYIYHNLKNNSTSFSPLAFSSVALEAAYSFIVQILLSPASPAKPCDHSFSRGPENLSCKQSFAS